MKKIGIVVFLLVLFTSIYSYSQTPFRGNLTAGINNPLGDFSNLYKGGVSVEAGLFYSLPLVGIDLTLTAGYNGFTYKNDYFTSLVSSNLSGATVSVLMSVGQQRIFRLWLEQGISYLREI